MTPIGKGESVSRYVARCVDLVDKSGLPYRLGPMGTCVEGSWDVVFDLIKRCVEAVRRDCNRLSVTIKVDDRKGAPGRLESKVRSVERRLRRPVRR